MPEDAPITKRLIISGLTPSITVSDLSKRLGTFGSVKATDGFGLVDGVGNPRKFAYVTLDTTMTKLAKCMNILSGSTWKGAKLRLGEAKPDFRERLALEREKQATEPPKKRPRLHGRNVGVHAKDMSLVTPENASSRPGWHVSALGRITRPIRTRPTHPLPPMQAETFSGTTQGYKKKKNRLKAPPSRARRKTIDMVKYGSTHLKGVFLDIDSAGPSKLRLDDRITEMDEYTDEEEDSSDESADEEEPVAKPKLPTSKGALASQALAPKPTQLDETLPVPAPIPPPTQQRPNEGVPDVEQEKTKSLALLSSLFGGDDDDWTGHESAGSDIDVDELLKGDKVLDEEVETFEIVPRDQVKRVRFDDSRLAGENLEDEEAMEVEEAPTAAASTSATKGSGLKSLFAPREEEGGFSLLASLGLDDELEEDIPFETTSSQPTSFSATAPVAQMTVLSSQTRIILDPKKPFFFPWLSTEGITKARPKDIFDVMKEDHWGWRDPAVAFYRTETEEEIRKKWEDAKGDLTKDWKKRAREAGKASRRKKGGLDLDE